ncbi:septum formation family protein [Salinibacterium sp. G-O1]|uniref:septum formation family protein n=1 Tax=Salinibacterium sp. G-O1 TaxID=3046208 RepID=UPI0024B8BEA2|nr:septum formation family protein [Salinibacterium sp. G-O1]MDJ0334588.1 septum formation family protein [Salinibacterium sp. G-O1]
MTISSEKIRIRALALFTIAAATVALTGCSLLGGGNDATDGGEGTNTDVFTIQVGDCLNDGDVTGEVSEVKVIDCDAEHDSEAYKSIKMTDDEFPGETAVDDMAISECKSAFSAFVGIDYDDSSLDFSYYYPTESSWAQGDREILCLVVDPEGKIAGSLKGASI